MPRKLFSLAALAATFGTLALAADEGDSPRKKGGRPEGGFDKGKMFEKMDANGDKAVSKDEFKTFFEEMAKRFADKGPGGKGPGGKGPGGKGPGGLGGEFAEKRFDMIDANKDGMISQDEFEKAPTGRGPGGPGGRPEGGFKGKGGPKGGDGDQKGPDA